MGRSPEDWDPSDDELVELDEDEDYADEDDDEARQPGSTTPMIMAILGIVLWFVCGVGAIGSIILGVKGQRKAQGLGQSDMLCKVAWIGGIVVLCLCILGMFTLDPTFKG